MLDIGKLKGRQLGSYHLDEKLGQGSFGAVYRANVVVGGRIIASPVAVKAIDPAHLDRKSPLRELENAATLKHRHLIEVIGHPGEATVTDATGASGTIYWFAMELATETLAQRLERGRLSETDVCDLIQQVGGALAWLHERELVHRDVKPGNILNVGGVWKLGDLGLTRRVVEGYYAQLKGTTLYLSPESFDDNAPKTCWDVWALGMTVLEAATGAHPFKGLTERKLFAVLGSDDPLPLPILTNGVADLVRGCLEKDPTKRWTAPNILQGFPGAAGPDRAAFVYGAQQAAAAKKPADGKPATPQSAHIPWKIHSGAWRQPGCVFQDADYAPRMALLTRGEFWMGSPNSEIGRNADEGPCHRVQIAYDVALGECAVTFAEWDAFVADGGYRPDDQGWGRGDMPVINVSWNDAQEYLEWLNGRLGLVGKADCYRLPTEAEWEYGCRGGASTPYWWGLSISATKANFNCSAIDKGNYKSLWKGKTVSVWDYTPNPFGLYQMPGNIWEWVKDGWHANYDDAPNNGMEWLTEYDSRRCLRGGSWFDGYSDLRSARRAKDIPIFRNKKVGFRVAKKLFYE